MKDMGNSIQFGEDRGMIARGVAFCLQNKLVVILVFMMFLFWGLLTAPFDWNVFGMNRSPVPVDAIPDIGENQQIVFTKWQGRSPQDIEDQITYPLTSALLGIPGVKTIRSFSMFGFSSIYIIFEEKSPWRFWEEEGGFYWTRIRVLEKLNSLAPGTLPADVKPTLGPDATSLGQIFWYTLEGVNEAGDPTGGWDPQELRSIQDWQVRFELLSVPGVSEVASVGGFVQEYQVEIDPDAMRAHGVTLQQVVGAVKDSNLDIGARTMEINSVEYIIRGLGFIKTIADIESAVVSVEGNVPLRVKDVARVVMGPALRRGALDKGGAEAVGGVVVVRYGANPLEVIKRVKEKIKNISIAMPSKTVEVADGEGVKKVLSRVKIVPFYDRTVLINETLGTLQRALSDEILVTIIVVLVLLMHFRSSILIAGLLPLAVLLCFILMRVFRVDANIVALSGIAIAIGTMVDMGIVLSENILSHLERLDKAKSTVQAVYDATVEVGGAVVTAVLTTVVSFLPVFVMTAAEGKLFKPLAWTKTFALISALIVSLALIPPLASMLFKRKASSGSNAGEGKSGSHFLNWLAAGFVTVLLCKHWMPMGVEKGLFLNILFVVGIIGGTLGLFHLVQKRYDLILKWCLGNKLKFLSLPLVIIIAGFSIWSGLGKEFMPRLDEGSFLFMPSTMPHASIGESMDVLSKQDMAISGIPEVENVVGKIGRADSPLDPAPVSMIETVINYYPEYIIDESGRRKTFKFKKREVDYFRNENGAKILAVDGKPYKVKGRFVRDEAGVLVPDKGGRPFRLWRPVLDPQLNEGREEWGGVGSPDDIWQEILRVTEIPGTTSASFLQPISARIVMLQSGMRAPMGVKIYGKGKVTLEDLERTGIAIEKILREVPSVKAASVTAERIVGKPYLELDLDRQAIARYGVSIADVQNVIQTAVGGMHVTATVEGRERYNVLVRYKRELRDSIESLERVLVPAAGLGGGQQVPLKELITGRSVSYRRGAQVIKSEDGALVAYVLFDKKPGFAEMDVKEDAERHLLEAIKHKQLELPAGVTFKFAGTFENQVRSRKTLMMVLPVALFVIFIILYLQFRSVSTSLLVFSGIAVAWAGGFVMIWLYGQSWFLDFSIMGQDMRELFQVHPINLSVAVWVGFLALFGIATDDGVVMATYLTQTFRKKVPDSMRSIRAATLEAGLRRVRPCLMTTATTILALIPVLTSTGKGADIMVPMAIPVFGGMIFEVITMFVVPVLYCAVAERRLGKPRVAGDAQEV